MRKPLSILLLCGICSFAQTAGQTTLTDQAVAAAVNAAPAITMPTYLAIGAAFNQLGTPRFNAFISGIVPVSQKGIYLATTATIIPVTKIDSLTGRKIYTASSQWTEGVHKTLYTGSRVQLLFGEDVGASFVSSATGMTVGIAAATTATFAYQLSPHWGILVPVKALYAPTIGGWNFIPQIAIVWKP